ncbi:MAG: hypothetical protein NTV24_04320 [Candidatus Woesebacteria bacterium]|nr:hypothetical protein [Candidatus Woesebacteria bacterium]
MVCEFSKNHNGNKTPEKPKLIIIPRNQPELDRRRSARREQPQEPKKKPNKS